MLCKQKDRIVTQINYKFFQKQKLLQSYPPEVDFMDFCAFGPCDNFCLALFNKRLNKRLQEKSADSLNEKDEHFQFFHLLRRRNNCQISGIGTLNNIFREVTLPHVESSVSSSSQKLEEKISSYSQEKINKRCPNTYKYLMVGWLIALGLGCLQSIQFQIRKKQMFTSTIKPQQPGVQTKQSQKMSSRELQIPKQRICLFRLRVTNMQKFIKDVEDKKVDPEDNVIFKYCGSQHSLLISASNIIQLLEKRIQRMIKNRKIKRNWSKEDLKILIWVVTHYTLIKNLKALQQMTTQDWNQISELIPGTTGESCMFKILGLKKIKLSEQQWGVEESNLLFNITENKHKIDWKLISEQLYLLNTNSNKIFRNAKQCKQHWCCFLNPKLKKGPWQLEEDVTLLERILENQGKKKWTQLAKIFQGRTQNALKNRFCLIVQRARSDSNLKDEISVIELALKMMRSKKFQRSRVNPRCKNTKKSFSSQSSSQLSQFEIQSVSKIEEIKDLQMKCESKERDKASVSKDIQDYNGVMCQPIFIPLFPTTNMYFVFMNQFNMIN